MALLALAGAAPVLALAAVAVKLSSPGPWLFRQPRVGRLGEPFWFYKLRSMHVPEVQASGAGVTAEGDSRVTSVGRWLRKLKVDELPELWNVVRGDLALVGPRPEVPRYVDLEDPRWRTVLGVRPGLTDPVTLRLRDEEGILARLARDTGEAPEVVYHRLLLPFKLDGYRRYLARRTWATDLRILVATAVAILLPGRVQAPTLEEILEFQPASGSSSPAFSATAAATSSRRSKPSG